MELNYAALQLNRFRLCRSLRLFAALVLPWYWVCCFEVILVLHFAAFGNIELYCYFLMALF